MIMGARRSTLAASRAARLLPPLLCEHTIEIVLYARCEAVHNAYAKCAPLPPSCIPSQHKCSQPYAKIGGDDREEFIMRQVVLIPDNDTGGYTVIVPSLPGCISEGDAVEEALANIREAIELHVESMLAHGEAVPDFSLTPRPGG
jgi:predicted RNase H-like HicB family nuclease